MLINLSVNQQILFFFIDNSNSIPQPAATYSFVDYTIWRLLRAETLKKYIHLHLVEFYDRISLSDLPTR